MKPHPRLPALVLALCLPLAGCGPKTENQTATAPAAPAPPAAATEADLAAGKAVYQRVCITCHMADGKGVPAVFPPLNGSPHLADADPGRLIRIVLHGLTGPVEVNGTTYNSLMPAQGGLLKDHEIAKVLTYVRHTWGHGASAVSPEEVYAIRKNTPRSTPWTWAELNQK